MCINVLAEGLEEPCKRKDVGDGVFEFEYYPTTPGTYTITITWGGQHIPRRYTLVQKQILPLNQTDVSLWLTVFAPFSPIEVKIGAEAGPQKVRAWGPGLEGGVVGKSADFVVEAVGDNIGTLGKEAREIKQIHIWQKNPESMRFCKYPKLF